MKKNSEYRAQALSLLKGNWQPAVIATLIILFVAALVSTPSAVAQFAHAKGISNSFGSLSSIFSTFVLLPLSAGYIVSFLQFVNEKDTDFVHNTVQGTIHNYMRYLFGMLLMSIFIVIGAFLFVIPGIILSCAYALTPFLLYDNPELSVPDALKLSRRLMQGHKMQYFLLELSFIGWAILACITAGIGFLWLTPYMQTSYALFYKDICGHDEEDVAE
ncbi:MAG: DUF975 family protein [Bacteroidales bacterium]|nr:DUF975 family protein [Bacteroidales bacterium]